MPVTTLPLANGFYLSDSLPISAQECTNFYPNIVQAPALSQETLLGTPGLEEVATTAAETDASINRGAHAMNGVPYFVNGGYLYKLTESSGTYTATSLGAIAGTTRVSMADNGTQLLVLVPGGDGFIYNHLTDVFAQITDSDFTANGDPQQVVFIDGYFCLTTDTKKFIVSSVNDGFNYNALDYGTAESDPDEMMYFHNLPYNYRNITVHNREITVKLPFYYRKITVYYRITMVTVRLPCYYRTITVNLL